MGKKQDETIDFEKSLAELEALVTAMEEGDLSLEESLKAFENGIRLTRNCQAALQQAEQKVQILMENDGQPQAFDSSSTEQPE